MATNTRKLASLLGASGAGIANDGTLTSAAIGEVIVAGDIAAGAVDTAELADDAVTSAKLDTNLAVAGTLGVTGAVTNSSTTTITGLLTTTGGIEDQNLKDEKIGANYYHFDKVDDQIRFPQVKQWAHDDIGIFSWMRTTSTDSSSSYAGNPALTILGDYNGTVTCSFGVNGGVLKMFKYNGGWTSTASTSSVNDGEWHHVGFTWDVSTGQVKFYIDGALDNTTTLAAGLYYYAYSNIGAGYSNGTVSGDFFDGDISSVQTYNYLLTAAEVKDLYNGLPITTFAKKSDSGFRYNILTNGDMETFSGFAGYDMVSWAQSNTHSHGIGSNTGLLRGTSGNTRIQSGLINLSVGKTYKATAWVYWNGTGDGVQLRRSSGGWTNMASTTTAGSGGVFTKLEAIFTAPDATDYMSIWLPGTGTTKEVWIDEFSCVPYGSIADYNGSSTDFTQWNDVSGADNHGTVVGDSNNVSIPSATLINTKPILHAAKAWITFQGTGTIAIKDSFNVSSISDQGTGIYDVQWKIPFADQNYAIQYHNNAYGGGWSNATNTSSMRMYSRHENNTYVDAGYVWVVVHAK